MADGCFPAERRPVDADITSQLARLHVVSLRPGKGAADRRRSSSSAARAGIGVVQAAALPAEAGVSPSSAGALLPLLSRGEA